MKRYFTLTKSQKIGAVVVAIIVILQIIFFSRENNFVLPDPLDVDTSLYAIHFKDKPFSSSKKNQYQTQKIEYYDFNPNEFGVKDWQNFGFSEKQAKIIVKYKSKIDGFKFKDDLKKVFVISEEKYLEIEPFIKLEHKKINETKSNFKKDKKPIVRPQIDLNSATSEELKDIHGIGEFTANGIVKYRTALGGFHSKIQLKEVYGISDENYEKILPQIKIDNSSIQKLNINILSVPNLKKHPYINWKTANAIIDERLKGKIKNIDFLIKNEIIKESEFNKLLPYIEY
jgi:competence ComEA-like helix-hairpin-helix protein